LRKTFQIKRQRVQENEMISRRANLKSRVKEQMIFLILTLLIVIPYIMNIVYSLPSADDFSMAKHYDLSSNILMEAFRQADRMYMEWTGEWFYSFVQTLINPLVLFGYSSKMLGVELAVLFILYIGAIILCTGMIAEKILGCERTGEIYLIQLSVLLIVLNTGIYYEVYYWFIGSSYMLEITLSLVCVVLIVKYHDKQSWKSATLLSIIGFFACNGIMVVSLICLVYLAMFLPDVVRKQRRLYSFVPFLFCLAGGLFAVAAPGNYRRHNSLDGTGIHIGEAVKNTLYVGILHLYQNFSNELIGMLLLTIVVISYLYARKHMGKIRHTNFLRSVLFFLIVMFFVIFPVTLGYSSADMPNRMQYMINTYMALGLGYLCVDAGLIMGSYMGSRSFDERLSLLALLALFVGFYVGPLSHGSIGLTPYAQQIVCHSETAACHDEWVSVLDEIKHSKNMDVEVLRTEAASSPLLKTPDMNADVLRWENTVVATYFHKNSVRLDVVNQ
jgi:hypothetical protein